MTNSLDILNYPKLPKSRVLLTAIELMKTNGGVWNESQISLARKISCSRNRLRDILYILRDNGLIEFGTGTRFNSPKKMRLKEEFYV